MTRISLAVPEEEVPQTLSIEKLRQDLRKCLAGYKMPTILRVVKELQKNATGKVVKKVLVKEYFPKGGNGDVQMWTGRKSRL